MYIKLILPFFSFPLRSFSSFLVYFFLWSLAANTHGQWGTTVPLAPESSEFKIETNFFSSFSGEKISIQSLKLSYEYEDVKIPGDNDMDMVVARRFDPSVFSQKSPLIGFGGVWKIDLPAITIRKIDGMSVI